MTDNDYRIEDRFEKGRPNYTLRRVKFAAAVVGLVVSVTLMLTWHGGGLTGALVVEGVYLATALWLIRSGSLRAMTWMATSDRISRRTRTRTDGGGVGPFISHCISRIHSHVFRCRAVRCGFESRRPGAWPDRQRRPHPRFVQLSWWCGNDGRASLLSWRPAVRLISINLISIKVKGGTDEGDSATLAFQPERSGHGRRHGGDDSWRQGGG